MNLFIADRAHRETQLEVAGHLVEVGGFRVRERYPLVQQRVLLLEVDPCDVELVVTDEGLLEEALVQEFDLDLRPLNCVLSL